jgi:hypothetical protein
MRWVAVTHSAGSLDWLQPQARVVSPTDGHTRAHGHVEVGDLSASNPGLRGSS